METNTTTNNSNEIISDAVISFWKTNSFQFFMDAIRVGLLLVAFLILFTLLSNINEVKLLASDPCKICMNKTGANCYYQQELELNEKLKQQASSYTLNISDLDKLLNTTT